MFKVNNKDTRRFVVFIVNIERISHLVLVFLLLTSTRLINAGWIEIKEKWQKSRNRGKNKQLIEI